MDANYAASAVAEGDVPSFAEFSIDECGSCGCRLALRSPTFDDPASTWICRRCGTVFFARCQERDGKPFSAGVRAVSYREVMKAIHVHIEARTSATTPQDVRQLVDCLNNRSFEGTDVRRQPRYHATVPVIIVPLSADLRAAGQPARVTTLNISSGGAAVIHNRPIDEPYLAIDFSPSGADLLPAIMEIRRVRTLSPAHEIAGRFVCRILQ